MRVWKQAQETTAERAGGVDLTAAVEKEHDRHGALGRGGPGRQIGSVDVRQVEATGRISQQTRAFPVNETTVKEGGNGVALRIEVRADEIENRSGDLDVERAAYCVLELGLLVEHVGGFGHASIHRRLHTQTRGPVHGVGDDEDPTRHRPRSGFHVVARTPQASHPVSHVGEERTVAGGRVAQKRDVVIVGETTLSPLVVEHAQIVVSERV